MSFQPDYKNGNDRYRELVLPQQQFFSGGTTDAIGAYNTSFTTNNSSNSYTLTDALNFNNKI